MAPLFLGVVLVQAITREGFDRIQDRVAAGAGYPTGAPAGAPEQLTWHGLVHELGFAIAILAWVALCVVFAGRFAKLDQRAWSRACWAVLASVLIVTAWPHLESLSTRLVVSSALSAGLVAAIAHDVRRGAARASATGGALDKHRTLG